MSRPSDGPLVVVGDALLDSEVLGRVERVCPDAPVPVVDETTVVSRPGGAGLAAVLAVREGTGRDVVLVTAVADDDAGERLRSLLADEGVTLVDLGLTGTTPEKVRIRADGQSLLRLDRGGPPGSAGPLTDAAGRAVRSAQAVLVADYGRGVASLPSVRRSLSDAGSSGPLVWDPHPKGADPVPGTWLATPNRDEAERAATLERSADGESVLRRSARLADHLRHAWGCRGVAVTMSEAGALLVAGDGPPFVAPPSAIAAGDPCGAGDRFAVAVAAALADGAVFTEAVQAAVEAATRFVASGGAAGLALAGGRAPAGSVGDAGHDGATAPVGAADLVRRVRAQGGTVVATGGCFDLLHAGHVSLLSRARALGDALVVCLNSDASVRRLKGDGRPIVGAADRVRVLSALASVDAVAVFDEDTPARLLDELRPDVFVKGGDYAATPIPEAAVIDRWGGQAVVVPYLEGRSTSRLVTSAGSRRA